MYEIETKLLKIEYLKEIEVILNEISDVVGTSVLSSRIRSLYDLIVEKETANGNARIEYVQIDTLFFELKVIKCLIDNGFIFIEYEPSGNFAEGKRVDLKLENNGKKYLIELKTTNPNSIVRRIPVEYLTHDRDCFDEQYFSWISSARGHMVDYIMDTDYKLRNYDQDSINIFGVYHNFYIEDYEMEYIWKYYKYGILAEDDALSKMMEHHYLTKNFDNKHLIHQMWLFPFEQYAFCFRDDERMKVYC